MAVSDDFIQYVLDQLSSWKNVRYKRMFGGAMLYCEGLAFGMIAGDILYMKVDDSNRNKYIKAGSAPLKPFKSHSVVLSFYNLPADILEDSDEFVQWAEESLTIQKRKNKIL